MNTMDRDDRPPRKPVKTGPNWRMWSMLFMSPYIVIVLASAGIGFGGIIEFFAGSLALAIASDYIHFWEF